MGDEMGWVEMKRYKYFAFYTMDILGEIFS